MLAIVASWNRNGLLALADAAGRASIAQVADS